MTVNIKHITAYDDSKQQTLTVNIKHIITNIDSKQQTYNSKK